jgi:hypothetical protein
MAKSKYKEIKKEYTKGVIDEFIRWYDNRGPEKEDRFLEGERRKYAPIWHPLKKSFLSETSGDIQQDNEDQV